MRYDFQSLQSALSMKLHLNKKQIVGAKNW